MKGCSSNEWRSHFLFCAEEFEEFEKTIMARLQIYLTEDLNDQVKAIARADGLSVSALVGLLLRSEVKKRKRKGEL